MVKCRRLMIGLRAGSAASLVEAPASRRLLLFDRLPPSSFFLGYTLRYATISDIKSCYCSKYRRQHCLRTCICGVRGMNNVNEILAAVWAIAKAAWRAKRQSPSFGLATRKSPL